STATHRTSSKKKSTKQEGELVIAMWYLSSTLHSRKRPALTPNGLSEPVPRPVRKTHIIINRETHIIINHVERRSGLLSLMRHFAKKLIDKKLFAKNAGRIQKSCVFMFVPIINILRLEKEKTMAKKVVVVIFVVVVIVVIIARAVSASPMPNTISNYEI